MPWAPRLLAWVDTPTSHGSDVHVFLCWVLQTRVKQGAREGQADDTFPQHGRCKHGKSTGGFHSVLPGANPSLRSGGQSPLIGPFQLGALGCVCEMF